MRRMLCAVLLFAISLFTITLFGSTAAASSPELRLPWTCNVSYYCSQGHNTGSHTGKGAWAWDFTVREGHIVTAPLAGRISRVKQDSTSYGCDSSYAHDANYVVVDFGNGTEALLMHLKAGSVRVRVGDWVEQGAPLGEVGLSGYVCGAHLHFQIQQTCGSWWCQSIPASFEFWGDPGFGDYLTSYNCPDGSGPTGDYYQVATSNCDVPANASYIIEDTDTCVSLSSLDWDVAGGGSDGTWAYTHTSNSSYPESVARWGFELAKGGIYQLYVHVPSGAQARQANYYVGYASGGKWGPITRDQATSSGWVNLGLFSLEAGRSLYIELPNNTGEANRVLAADAVAIVPHGSPAPPPADEEPPAEQEPPAEEEPPADEEPPAEEEPPADEPLAVDSITPNTITIGSTVSVTVSGSGIVAGAQMTLHGGAGPTPGVVNTTVWDSSTLTATVQTRGGGPPRARTWDVRITNPDGSVVVLANGLTLVP